MKQPFVVLDMDGKSYPVLKLIWSHWDGTLVMVHATTPFVRNESRMDFYFNVVENTDTAIKLAGTENPNFTGVLMIS